MSVSLSSKSRDDYEFTILPWEYQGADFDPRPDSVVEMDLVFRHEMMLKVKQNYLFVREAGDDPDRTYAVLQPLAKTARDAEALKTNPERLTEIFQEARKANNIAKMHVISRMFHARDIELIGFLCPHGNGVFREYWDADGVPFQLKQLPLRLKEVWHHHPGAMNRSIETAWSDEIGEELVKREVPEQVLEGERLRWVRGSETELRKLVTWFVQGLSNESAVIEYLCASRNPLRPEGGIKLFSHQNGRVQMPVNLSHLIQLFLQHNVLVGSKWSLPVNTEHPNPMRRGSCNPESFYFGGKIAPPTAHERLEAKLNLRNWLRGKLPEAEIQRLLS